jgi:mannan endo-1,4-beta-mannosidase
MRVSSILSACSAVSAVAAQFTNYAKTSSHVFTINGKTEYFAGTNTYWLGFQINNADVDLVMSHLAAVGNHFLSENLNILSKFRAN